MSKAAQEKFDLKGYLIYKGNKYKKQEIKYLKDFKNVVLNRKQNSPLPLQPFR